MKNKTILQLIAVGACCVLLGSAQAQQEGDPVAGKDKFYTCTGCHAIPGYTNVYPTYHVPRLGGQHAPYVVAALSAYKAGDRPHETMQANAANLSEQDMANIAAYVNSLGDAAEAVPVWGDSDAGQKKSETCQACHGPDGNSPDPNFPRLAGQYEDYLTKALHDYKSGERKNAIMNGIVAALSEQDIADLAAFYASQSQEGLATIHEFH